MEDRSMIENRRHFIVNACTLLKRTMANTVLGLFLLMTLAIGIAPAVCRGDVAGADSSGQSEIAKASSTAAVEDSEFQFSDLITCCAPLATILTMTLVGSFITLRVKE
jgi:hypothetical protein